MTTLEASQRMAAQLRRGDRVTISGQSFTVNDTTGRHGPDGWTIVVTMRPDRDPALTFTTSLPYGQMVDLA